MTQDASKLASIRKMVENAETALRTAKQLLEELEGGKGISPRTVSARFDEHLPELNAHIEGDLQIIEGIFDGQNMIGPNKKAYPVPPNYASKSKLIKGDVLKLTITPEGSFIYKQIKPIEREHRKGHLALDEGQYRVIADGKTYNVLLASVTYFKANAGDEITIVVPKNGDCEWAAIENVIPRI